MVSSTILVSPSTLVHSGIDNPSHHPLSDSTRANSTIGSLAANVFDSSSLDSNHLPGTVTAPPRLNSGTKISIDDQYKNIEERFKYLECRYGNLMTEVKEFLESLKTYEKRYALQNNFFDNAGANLGVILSGAEYAEVNDDLITNPWGKEGYKWAESLFLLIYHSAKSIVHYKLSGDFEDEVKKFGRLKPKVIEALNKQQPFSSQQLLKALQKQMDLIKRYIEQDREKIFSKAVKKIQKFVSRISAIPLNLCLPELDPRKAHKICKNIFGLFGRIYEKIFIDQALTRQKEWVALLQTRIRIDKTSTEPSNSYQELKDKVLIFKNLLLACTTPEDVRKILNNYEMTSIEVPATIEQWQEQMGDERFIRSLYYSFNFAIGKTHFWSNKKLADLLKKRENEHSKNIDRAKPIISHYIEECKDMEFPHMIAYFKTRHIHLETIKIENCPDLTSLPTTKEEWLKCTQSKLFRRSLAEQYVNHQDTSAQQILLAARQMLLSKNRVERDFLGFRKKENFVSFASSFLQLIICCEYFTRYAVVSVFELIVTDISKFGIPGITLLSIGHPLYPNKDFKLLGISMMLIEHFFAIKDKPNEYSFEGYKLNIQIRWFYLVARTHQLISLFQQMVLWLNMRLIENCIMGLNKKPFESDQRYIDINEDTKLKLINCKTEIEKLEKSLDLLKVKDAKLCISSDSKRSSTEEADPIQILAESLKDANPEFFPTDVLEYLEDNLGIDLKEENKSDIQKQLERFFSKGEGEFIDQYQENRFAYLRKDKSPTI